MRKKMRIKIHGKNIPDECGDFCPNHENGPSHQGDLCSRCPIFNCCGENPLLSPDQYDAELLVDFIDMWLTYRYKKSMENLLSFTNREDSTGRWRVILDYDNYQDGARVMDGDENILGQCYDIFDLEENDEDVREQFLCAIYRAGEYVKHLESREKTKPESKASQVVCSFCDETKKGSITEVSEGQLISCPKCSEYLQVFRRHCEEEFFSLKCPGCDFNTGFDSKEGALYVVDQLRTKN